MGRRAFTNPSKIESESERVRNRRRRRQERHQNLARQERLAHPGICVNNSAHDQVQPEDRSCSGLMHNSTTIPCTDGQGLPSLTSQLTETRHDAEQFAAYVSASPTLRLWSASQRVSPETCTPRGCTLESTRARTRLRIQRYRNRLHRLRIPPSLPSVACTDGLALDPLRKSNSGAIIDNHHSQSTDRAPDHPASIYRVEPDPQTHPERSRAGSSQYASGLIASDVDGNRNETLDSFDEALRHQDNELRSDFLDSHEAAYDQAFRIFFHSKCTLGSGENDFEVHEPEHTCSLRESIQYYKVAFLLLKNYRQKCIVS
ncbi:hypothetical protein FMUND_13934 [Fusarium mundagurra]|uniref:Uncharacterized protein n=1 Tax=Fusarium mundagurra TaxID=1567541 RepID=A0A8H5XXU3_9HYPO|nr:hypothetical protein FMUND_13934 [Fusarium mundagurra]